MGVGTPVNLLENIALGIDMFDCVMPTRNGRNGMLFTSEGIINIKNKKWEFDFSLLDKNGSEIKRKTIFVNEPFVYNGLTLYQTAWKSLGIKFKFDNKLFIFMLK